MNVPQIYAFKFYEARDDNDDDKTVIMMVMIVIMTKVDDN